MNNKFDELTKGLAQLVTRRAALKKFGLGLAGMALAGFGLANKAVATPKCLQSGSICSYGKHSDPMKDCRTCCSGLYHCDLFACACL